MRRHPGDWLATWSAHPTWIVDGREIEGRDAVLAAWRTDLRAHPFVIHTACAPNLAITDGVARGRCTAQEIRVAEDGSTRRLFFVCHDEFARGDGWLFHRRRFDLLLSRPLDLSAAEVRAWPAAVDPAFLR